MSFSNPYSAAFTVATTAIQMKQQSCIKANYFDEAEFSDLRKKSMQNLVLFMYFQSSYSKKSERNLKLAFFGL